MSTEGKPSVEEKIEHSSEHPDIDLYSFHEQNAGRLVIDPAEAKVEFGESVAARLKLSRDGTKVLWPQPTDSPDDPQNWSDRRKFLLLIIVTLAAIVPDFDSGIGIAAIFKLAAQYNTTTGVINNLTSNMVIRRLGCLPVLLWSQDDGSQLLALGFLIGATFAPNLNTFTVMRCLTAFFGTAPQVAGVYIVTDLYPFHLQARMLNFWTMGFLVSPFLSPFAFGFLVARTSWRWAYGIGSMCGAIVVVLIVLFMEETMYDRTVRPIPERPSTPLRYRVETLVGITGFKMQKYRVSWTEGDRVAVGGVEAAYFRVAGLRGVFLRAQERESVCGSILLIELPQAMLFGFGIGINVTNAVFLDSPPPVGFDWSQFAMAGGYGTPIVSVIFGELIGRYMNEWIQNSSIRRNNGVFEAESRLWCAFYAFDLICPALNENAQGPAMSRSQSHICGFVTLGASVQKHLSPGAVIMGWGLAELAIMINTVAVYAYCNDAFPKHQGEGSALINLFRGLGGTSVFRQPHISGHLIENVHIRKLGFAVPYFQVMWATKRGTLQVLGVEAAIVTGLFLLVVPTLQLKGRGLRLPFLTASSWYCLGLSSPVCKTLLNMFVPGTSSRRHPAVEP
ncbi:MFS general substrate transporter [Mycena sanguinolenta]|uniref:MFS general substrate transporter n=1 Tax=Mycena sanguinolenta TaxID=230812 RepID=A0A8H7D1K0_9AGAR|nr:MFS general substrate transporter [Mycena sanguinolenta]